MPATKPVVFLSSTAADLKPYREAAAQAARQAGFYDVRMEDFEAQSAQKPYPACMAKVRECDVLVVIIAHRYGWVPPDQPDPKQAKSITWLECEEALKHDREILAFVIADQHDWPTEKKESHRAAEAIEKGNLTAKLQKEIQRNVKKLAEFKAWINDLGFRRTFTTPEKLQSEIQHSLTEWLKRNGKTKTKTTKTNAADPTQYLHQLREQTRWIDIRGLQVGAGKAYRFPIDELYIPLTSAGGEANLGLKNWRGTKQQDARLEQALTHQRLLIEGDPGAGKTTFLRHIAYQLCRDDGRTSLKLANPKGFPLYLRVGDLETHIHNCRRHEHKAVPTTDHAPAWLPHYLAAAHPTLPQSFFEAKLKTKDTTLLLDGLDEAENELSRASLARLVTEAVTAYPQARFIVTTRPQAYTGNARLPGFHEVRIADLEPAGIAGFLAHWSRGLYPGDEASATRHHAELQEALSARPAIRRMARNPVMLTALAVVHWNERRLPEQRADLYQSIATWLARARDTRPGRTPADRVLALLGHLALGMQLAPKGRITQVSKATAAEILAPEFRESTDPSQQLEQARRFLVAEEVDSGIFVTRGSDLRFWHLTLQEYLAAATIAGLPDGRQQKLLFEKQRLHQAEWREVMLLFGGILIGQGRDKVDAFFTAMLDQVPAEASLAQKARCAGLIGAMLRDLRPFNYNIPDGRYQQMLADVLAIFDAKQSQTIDIKTRVEAAEALGQAGDPRLRLPKDGDYWVRIPAGNFTMGEGASKDEPPHEVYLDSYRIGRYPVTVQEYSLFLEHNEDYQPPEDWEQQSAFLNRPVVNVTWHDAQAYCDWAKVRLPTEAEWERAARGQEGRVYAWGHAKPTPDLANYDKSGVAHASPVGIFPQGSTLDRIADLTGNVEEWCTDWYGENYYEKSAQENPNGPKSGETKCLRGGCWHQGSAYLRAADRGRNRPNEWFGGLGFRCARE